MEAIKKIDKTIQLIGEAISGICMLAMCIIVTVAVVCRWLGIQFVASDELARYVMIWSIYIGIIICTRERGHVAVTIVLDALKSEKAKSVLMFIIDMIVIATLVWLFILSNELVAHAVKSGQSAPITKTKYWFMYLSMSIGFGMSIVRQVELLIVDFFIRKKPDIEENKLEKEEASE